LNFTGTPTITSSWDPATGILLLEGTDTVANYQAALRAVTFENTNNNQSQQVKTISFTVNDGDSDSGIVTRDVSFTPVNDAPVLTSIEQQPAIYTENTAPVGITGNLTVNDVDDSVLDSATLSINNNLISTADELVFVDTPNIVGNYNITAGVLTLSGSATVAEYEAAIQSVAYRTLGDNPSVQPRSVSISVNDGDEDSNILNRDVSVVPVNDAPAEFGIETSTLSYAENSGPVVISPGIALSDSDDTDLESAIVQLSGNYNSAEDSLDFTDTPNITSSWDNNSGTLTLTGTDTVANYQTALRSVTYENSSANPSSLVRTVIFSVNDGDVSSNSQSRDIDFSVTNNAPVLTSIELQPAVYSENQRESERRCG